MSVALKGKDKILAFRRLKDAETKDAFKLALQVEHTMNKERSTETTQTKDGPIVSSGGIERTIDITAISSLDELNIMLEKSVDDGDELEIWEINLATRDAEGKCDALYMRGHLNSWSTPNNVESLVEISTTASITGKPKEGKITLTAEQEAEIDYAFRDLAKVTSP